MNNKLAYYLISAAVLTFGLILLIQTKKEDKSEVFFQELIADISKKEGAACKLDKSLKYTTVTFLDLTCSTCIEQLDNIIESTNLNKSASTCSNIVVIYEGVTDSVQTKLQSIESKGICTFPKSSFKQDVFLFGAPFTVLLENTSKKIRIKVGYNNYTMLCT